MTTSKDDNLKMPGGTKSSMYTPDELKTLVDALNTAPSYLSKRFILKRLCGWSDSIIEENTRLKLEENEQARRGDISWR
jgi:hypothetical protein